MYINISDNITVNNKGSCAKLVNYLEKENRIQNNEAQEYWFNHTGYHIEPYEARNSIDRNIAKLSNYDAKFFLINISPSQKELRHLIEQFGEQRAKEEFKHFAEKVMDEYARNFKRPGINSAKDLLWFGKLENHRYYTHKDKEVINGTKKRGDLKAGEQMHIQIIVSRKDASNLIKLSPMNKSRGKNVEHSKKLGQFNRVAFKQSGETLFDQVFKFERKLNETLAYANIQKNGDLNQRVQLDRLAAGARISPQYSSKVNEMVKELRNVINGPSNDTQANVGSSLVNEVLADLLGKQEQDFTPFNPRKRKKRKKRHQQINPEITL